MPNACPGRLASVPRRFVARLLHLFAGPSRDSRSLGEAGERVAASYLRRRGYKILGRNIHVPMGEADILCLDPDRSTVVVVEVKTREVDEDRRSIRQRDPEASVTARKRRKLASIARHLARANRFSKTRIDVVAVEWPPGGPPEIRHHTDAVRA